MGKQSRTLILALSLWLIGGTACTPPPPEIPGFDIKNFKTYSNCSVGTRIDMLTDEEEHIVECEGPMSGFPKIRIVSWRDKLGVLLFVREQFSPRGRDPVASIPVAIRIDKRPLIRKTASWNRKDHSLGIFERDFALSLLDELATGGHVAFRVGDEQGHIRLPESAAAIAYFRSIIRS